MSSQTPPIIFILFDIDGTLLRAAGSGRVATERAMREVFGTSGNLADYKFGGKTDWFTLHLLLTAEGISEAEIEAALPRYNEVAARHLTEIIGNYKVIPLPGTLEIVKTLHSRPDVLLGILTGNVPLVANMKLRAAGFDPDMFAVGVYGTEARIRRDLVPIVLARAEQHANRRFDPVEVVFIGDTPEDIDCAHSIGARAVAVCTGMVNREELEAHPPVTILEDLADQAAALAAILGDK